MRGGIFPLFQAGDGGLTGAPAGRASPAWDSQARNRAGQFGGNVERRASAPYSALTLGLASQGASRFSNGMVMAL